MTLCTVPEPSSALGELRYPVHAVVIGNGDGGQAAFRGLGDQLTGSGSTVQEAVRRMTVQLRPRDRRSALTQPSPPGRPGGFPPCSRQLSDRASWLLPGTSLIVL